jgi:p-aminobenzoyl-glutamate transporter AbgT
MLAILMIVIGITVMVVCFACELLKYKIIRPAMGDLKGLQAGMQYSAELRRLRKQQPETATARRVKVLDRIGLFVWLIAAAAILLWKFKLVQ